MARLLFFGKLAEIAGARAREISLAPETRTIADLVVRLRDTEETLAQALNEKSLRFVVNEMVVGPDAMIGDDDEIAFLPPVSGG